MSGQDSTILVVEDDRVTRHFVCEVLRGLGNDEILQADNGLEAKAILESHDVDLVITDLIMPGLDGLGLMRWAGEHRPAPRWIVLSGVDTFRAAIEAHQLGVIDFLSKPLAPEELEVTARSALDHLRLLRERERLFTELEHANRQLSQQVVELEARSDVIRRDLQRAEVIQRALLPATPPDLEGFSLQAVYRPGLHVGGDLYDVVRIDERRVAFVVADATGHGVASAMLSVLFSRRLSLRDERASHSPARALERVNDALIQDRVGPGLFVTAVLALLDTGTRQLTLASAGHPPAALRAAGTTTWFPRSGPALGLVAHATYDEHSVTLDHGDRLLLFTDGLFDDGGAALRSRIDALLAQPETIDCARLAALLEPPAATAGDAERDDATLLLLDAAPGASRFDNGHDDGAAARPAAAPATIWYGEGNERSWIAVRGRGRWTDCQAFHETVCGLLDEGFSVVVDLSDCDYLDSTFLGTTHELVCRALDTNRAPLVLNGVSDSVRDAFAELSMDRVLACVSAESGAPPELHPLGYDADMPGSRLRLLHAHEALSALSAANRERFSGVTDVARARIADAARSAQAMRAPSDRTRPTGESS